MKIVWLYFACIFTCASHCMEEFTVVELEPIRSVDNSFEDKIGQILKDLSDKNTPALALGIKLNELRPLILNNPQVRTLWDSKKADLQATAYVKLSMAETDAKNFHKENLKCINKDWKIYSQQLDQDATNKFLEFAKKQYQIKNFIKEMNSEAS